MLLATFLDSVQDVIAKLENFFTNFQLLYAFEWLIFFLTIYYVSKILRENDATKLMLIYWAALLCGGVMLCCAPDLFSKPFFLAYILLLSAVMLIFFNVEVKKMLWDVHQTRSNPAEKAGGRSSEVHSSEDVEHCIGDIIKAVQNMSKSKTGALIVLSRGSLPKNVTHSGVVLEADISSQLIESVFFPNSPLHDGAMVILNGRIAAARCTLPITQKTDIPANYGMRHNISVLGSEVQ